MTKFSPKHGIAIDSPAHNTDSSTYEPRYISLDDFKNHGSIPRCGSNADFKHPTTAQSNATHLLKLRSSFDPNKTAFIFVSHCWLKPGEGADAHPDNLENDKYKRLLTMIEKLSTGPDSLVPDGHAVAVWIGPPRSAADQSTREKQQPAPPADADADTDGASPLTYSHPYIYPFGHRVPSPRRL